MYAAESFVLRASIVLGLVAAVMTILYFTPYPDEYFLSCDRPCHELDWPMICRVQLTLEPHLTQTSLCQECSTNSTDCDPLKCPIDDGKLRQTLAASLQVPGPAIQICHNDILVVDVINKIPGKGMTIHWRGQPQAEAPFMDGVPMITQCPISSFTAFQYKFRASEPGTHLWHAHSGAEVLNGFHGALIVREAERMDKLKKYYDYDDKNHVILVSQSTMEISTSSGEKYVIPKSLLVNGKPPSESQEELATFKVKKGKRHRFRLAYSGAMDNCPVSVRIDQHIVKVISLDGNGVTPYEVSSITLSKGERVDFVLKAKEWPGSYLMRFESTCEESKIEGFGLVQYEVEKSDKMVEKELNEIQSVEREIPQREFNTAMCASDIGKVCAVSASALKKIPAVLKEETVDKKMFLTFDYRTVQSITTDATTEKPTAKTQIKIYRMNNITFTYPSSPLLTQYAEVPLKTICNTENKPKKCYGVDACECVHVEEIPLGATVELILIDQAGDSLENVFHLHGYKFYVVGHKQFEKPITLAMAQSMEEQGTLVERNLHNPVLKDTVRVPRNGVVAIRFLASNAGYWMLRDENAGKWSRGMDIVFKVGGNCDAPSAPSNFPQCGSWLGPDFFLL